MERYYRHSDARLGRNLTRLCYYYFIFLNYDQRVHCNFLCWRSISANTFTRSESCCLQSDPNQVNIFIIFELLNAIPHNTYNILKLGIVSRFSNPHGVEGTRFSNEPYQGMYENMSTVNQQYPYHIISGNNVPNIQYDFPTPENTNYEGAPVSCHPEYANNNEVIKKFSWFIRKYTTFVYL